MYRFRRKVFIGQPASVVAQVFSRRIHEPLLPQMIVRVLRIAALLASRQLALNCKRMSVQSWQGCLVFCYYLIILSTGKQRLPSRQADLFRRLKIDHKLKLRRLFRRQIGGFAPFSISSTSVAARRAKSFMFTPWG